MYFLLDFSVMSTTVTTDKSNKNWAQRYIEKLILMWLIQYIDMKPM